MPKIFLYITAKVIWTYVIWGTDSNESRAHVHVGQRDTEHFCKIWLEPEVEIAKPGSLTQNQLNDVLDITKKFKNKLLNQWSIFKKGGKITIIKIKE